MHRGSCHCGKVAFEFEGEIGKVMECNCSHCRRKGFLLCFVPRESLRVTQGEDALATYHFNKHVIDHLFCPTCGVQAFGFGTGPDGRAMAAINVRCVDGVDPGMLEIQPVDGASL